MFSLLKQWIKPGAESSTQDDVDDAPINTKKRSYHDTLNEHDEPASNKAAAASPLENEGDIVMLEEDSSADELDLMHPLKPYVNTHKNVSEAQRPAKRARSISFDHDTVEAAAPRLSASKPQLHSKTTIRHGQSATSAREGEEREEDMDIATQSERHASGESASTSMFASRGQQISYKGKERAVSEELEEQPARPASASAMAKRAGAKPSATNAALSMGISTSGKAVLSRKSGTGTMATGAARSQKPASLPAKPPSPILVQASIPVQSHHVPRKSLPIQPTPILNSAKTLSSAGSAIASTSKLPLTSVGTSTTVPKASASKAAPPVPSTSKAALLPKLAETPQPWPPEVKYTSLQQLNNYTTKPPYFWWVLGRAGILGAPGKKATLQGIAEAIAARYPYYVEAKNSGALVRSLRSALAAKACFSTHKDSDKNVVYTVDESINPLITRYNHNGGRKSDVGSLSSASMAAPIASGAVTNAASKPQAVASTSKVASQEDLVNKFIKNLLANPPVLPILPPSEHQVFATSLTSLPTAEELLQSNLKSMSNTGATSISAALMQRSHNTSDMGKLQKVPFPLFTLARAAILGSPYRKLRLEGIAKSILERYPQLSNPDKEAAFRRQLTQTLNKHKCFYRASDHGHFNQSSWMVDLQIDPRLARHDPTANMGRKETAQHREAFSIACRDLADDEKTDLDTLVEELESHTAYYARSDERTTRRKESLALSMLGPNQPLPRLPTPPPPPKQRTPSPELDEEPPRPRASPIKSASRPTVRLPSPEIPIPPPSTVRKGTMSIKGRSAASVAPQSFIPPSRSAGTSSPEPLAFSGASSRRTSSLERTDSRDSRAAAPSIKGNTTFQDRPIIVLSGDSDSEDDNDMAPHSPAKLPYICGYTDYKTALMCEESFGDNDERLRHLRYEHGQIQAQYLVPRIPQAASAALPKTTQKKKKKKPAVRKAQIIKPAAISMAKKQPTLARQPAKRQQSVEV